MGTAGAAIACNKRWRPNYTKKPPFPTIDEVISEIGKKAFDIITVLFNNEAVTIRKPRLTFTLNGHDAEVICRCKAW